MKCRICDSDLVKCYESYLNGSIELESQSKCPNGHYNFFHSHGNYEVFWDVDGNGNYVFSYGYSYNAPEEELKMYRQMESQFVELSKALNARWKQNE